MEVTGIKIGCRPVRIYFTMQGRGGNPNVLAIKQVLPLAGNEKMLQYVDSADEADLIFFKEMRDVERGYSKDKFYAFIPTQVQLGVRLPENCTALEGSLISIVSLIQDVWLKLKPLEVPVVKKEEKKIPLKPNARHILVVDDTREHIDSALVAFAGDHITVEMTYDGAIDKLRGDKKFDIVLTDMQLPMSSKSMGAKFKLGEPVHYGFLIRDEAARRGAKYIGVVTAVSHHDDAISAAIDHHGQFVTRIECAKTMLIHAHILPDGSKDWAGALKRLVEA